MCRLVHTCLLISLAVVPAAAEETADPFSVPICIGLRLEYPDGEPRHVMKLVRNAYTLEAPFHVPLDELRLPLERHNSIHPDAIVTPLYFGHGGFAYESAVHPRRLSKQYEFVLFLTEWIGSTSEFEVNCVEFPVPERIAVFNHTDPYTGNRFVVRQDRLTVDLLVIDPGGDELARIRTDLDSGETLEDLCDDSFAELAPRVLEPGGFFWFDLEKLAPFVEVYRTIGGGAYARFIVDAVLAQPFARWVNSRLDWSGMRLPFLPSVTDAAIESSPGLDRLQNLTTDHSPYFRARKPKKGGLESGILPALRLVEARECLHGGPDPAADGICPTFSAMALQTEMMRLYPESLAAGGSYTFADVFDVIVQRGLCREELYPFPEGAAIGWTKTIDEFAKRAEKALNRKRESGQERVKFVDGLPPACAAEMRAFREERELPRHALVELMAAQHRVGSPLDELLTDRLRRAQQQELMYMVGRLLEDGTPVVALGDGENLRIGLLYGANDVGVLVMDRSAGRDGTQPPKEIPFDVLADDVVQLAYLRDEFTGRGPTVRQLRRAIEHAGDDGWTYYQLGILLQEKRRHREAIEVLRKAVEIDPEDASTRLELAESLSATAHFDEAVNSFVAAIDLGLDAAYSYGSLGYAQRKLGRYSDALGSLERAVELDSTYTWAMQQVGWAQFDSGDETTAELWFRKARKNEPIGVAAHIELAKFLAHVGRPDAAREVLLDAVPLFSDAPDLGTIGAWLLRLGYAGAAVPILERAAELAEHDAWYRLALGRAYLDVDDLQRATAMLEPVISRSEPGVAGLLDVGFARALLGRHQDSPQLVEDVLGFPGEADPLDLYDLACITALNGDLDGALGLLEQALQRGYQDYRWARGDSDFSPLAADPRFEGLLDRYGKHER